MRDLTIEELQEQLGVEPEVAAYLAWIAQSGQPQTTIADAVVDTLRSVWGSGTWPNENDPLIVYPFDLVEELIQADFGLTAFDDEHVSDSCYDQTREVYTRSIEEGLDEDAASAAQSQAQDECAAHEYREWQNAVQSILGRVLEHRGFGLDLDDATGLPADAAARWIAAGEHRSMEQLPRLWMITPEAQATWLTILWALNQYNGDVEFEGVTPTSSPRDQVLARLSEIIRKGEADYGTTIKRMWRNRWR